MANVSITVAANTADFTGATATVQAGATDINALVTFTTSSTIPGAGPYKLFTLTFAGSYGSTYPIAPTFIIFPCSNAFLGRTAAQQAATAALGPFFCIANAILTTCTVYCTNAPSPATSYDIGFAAVVGP